MTQPLALALSLLLELPVVVGLCLALGWVERRSLLRLLAVGAAATLLTHPFAWHGFTALKPWVGPYWLRALLLEGGVAVVEGLLYAALVPVGRGRGQILGWAANAWSYGFGLGLLALGLV